MPNSTSEADESEYKHNKESLSIGVGDWILVCYDGDNFPRKITEGIGELDFEVNVMHRGAYWKWPLKEDKIF